jgi:hypothetical protein
MSDNDKTSIFEVLEAVGAAIKASDAPTRELLAQTMAAYRRDCPDQYRWATGTQAPVFLVELMWAIEEAAGSSGKCDFDLANIPAQGRA